MRPGGDARPVFAALGGVVEIGALNHAGTWKTSDTSVGDFLALRRDEVARIVAGVQAVGRFSDPVMAEAHELGYLRDHPVDVRSLLLWSAGVTWAPRGPRPSEDDLAYLEDPQVMRRMCRMGADLQLTCLLDGLVAAGVGAGVGLPEGTDEIASILRLACELVDGTGRNTPEGVFRMWRVAHLPGLLDPNAAAPEWVKAGHRVYDEELERLLTPM
ncbi:hypothetical protein ABT076_33650 [Streptomyces sp. NPDC002131]|uniref:hypothetical protein n=1 Tax=unclassified Streptomyces TaxID=2593676 RepID=UPI00224EE6D7|nr:hypothetical protein [Streptomyces sp. NBC_00340]MCX5131482.1 hypothetical protein [Streptomyces sp. NBC_00340]